MFHFGGLSYKTGRPLPTTEYRGPRQETLRDYMINLIAELGQIDDNQVHVKYKKSRDLLFNNPFDLEELNDYAEKKNHHIIIN